MRNGKSSMRQVCVKFSQSKHARCLKAYLSEDFEDAASSQNFSSDCRAKGGCQMNQGGHNLPRRARILVP